MRPAHARPYRRANLSFTFVFLLASLFLPIATFAQAGNFSAFVNYPVAPSPINTIGGVVVGAFTSSKVLDIAAATESSTVSILLGNGDGTFQAQYTVPTVPSTGPYSSYLTQSIAVGDFNGDGNLDLAVLCTNWGVTSGPVQGAVIILLGDGTGHFTAQTPIALDGTDPAQVLAAEFDTKNNSNIDLAVLNRVSDSVTILLGNGDATFTALPDTSILSSPTGNMAAADFNKDGNIDLAIPDGDGLGIFLGNGDGTFQAITNWTPPSSSAGFPFIGSPAVGDFNGDGNLDIAAGVANEGQDGLYVFLGEGNGSFQVPAIGSPVFPPGFLVTGDFNSDGKLDLASGGEPGGPQFNDLQLYLGNGNGTFSADAVTDAGITSSSVSQGLVQGVVADVNGDGYPDLVIAGYSYPNNFVSVLLNCGLRCTSTTVTTLSPTTAVYGQPVTFTATVTLANAKATGTPTGTVMFQATTVPARLSGGSPVTTTLGSATLSGAVATLTISNLGVGQYIISAIYQGDSNFNASNSMADPGQPPTLTVNDASTTTSLSSSTDPSAPGQSVTLTATVAPVAPGSGVPTGTVAFSVNGNALATQPLNSSGVATLMISSLPTGTDSITTAYSGDSNFSSSTSSTVSQLVGTSTAPFAVSASPGSKTVSAGGSAMFTITLATAPSLKSAISFSCSGLPMGASCSFSPAQITPKGASATTTLTISTTGSGSVFDTFRDSPRWPSPALPFAFLSLLVLVTLTLTRKQQTQRAVAALVLLCIFAVLTGVVACGGNSSPQNVTPQGTSQITVMASANGQSQTTIVSLTVN